MAYASAYCSGRCSKCWEIVPAKRIAGVVTLRTHKEAHSEARCEGSNTRAVVTDEPRDVERTGA